MCGKLKLNNESNIPEISPYFYLRATAVTVKPIFVDYKNVDIIHSIYSDKIAP
jgi:hypothetical protein